LKENRAITLNLVVCYILAGS